jgi:hypothetical protein
MSNTYLQTLEQLETAENPFVVISGIFLHYCDDSISSEDIFMKIVDFCLEHIEDVIPEELEEKKQEYLALVLASLPEIWPDLLRKVTHDFYHLDLPLEADYKEKSAMIAKILNFIHEFEEDLY